jgi:hypothetical protein
LFAGALAALYKYGDRTDLAKKSLDGTKEALDGLRAYLGRALAEAVKPTVERILEEQGVLQDDGTLNVPPDALLEEFRGETFQDDVSAFVTRDLDEMISYKTLVHERKHWSTWAQRLSWGVYVLMAVEFIFMVWFGLANKVFSHPVSFLIGVISFIVSGVVVVFCILSFGVMLRCHDKISAYRDKIL